MAHRFTCALLAALLFPAFAYADDVLAAKSLWERKAPELLNKQALAAIEWKKSKKKAQALEQVTRETKSLSPLFEAYQKTPGSGTKEALTAGITRFCEAVGRLHKTQGSRADKTYAAHVSETQWMAVYFGQQRSLGIASGVCDVL